MTALVTGAAGGIGSAIADGLAAAGTTVLRHDLREQGHGGAMDVAGDLTDPQVLDRIAQRVRQDGVDLVVAAHGVAGAEALATIEPGKAARIMSANTVSVMRLYDAVAPVLGSDGVFVAVSSQAGLVGEANNGVYCASKFALVGWSQGLRRQRGPRPRLRLLCPGATDTPLLQAAFQGMADSAGVDYQVILDGRSAQIPVGRLGRTDDLAAAVRWLADLPAPRTLVAAVSGGEVLW
jgi:NAD(P)-dependent dehydrogenase (short-subunit alcohol dehydrogenase family)